MRQLRRRLPQLILSTLQEWRLKSGRTLSHSGHLCDLAGRCHVFPDVCLLTVVDAFSNAFSASFLGHACDAANTDGKSVHMPSFRFGYVTEEEIVAILRGLPGGMTSGDDQVPGFLLHDCRYVFAEPLAAIINMTVRSSVFPSRWKITRVTPVLKKGDPALVGNYRPISIISNFSKACEIFFYRQIFGHVKPFLSPSQHGFHPGRSTETNLSCFVQYISDSIECGQQVDVVYTDFSKAFDKMSHDVMLTTLGEYGFCDSAVALVRSYLHARTNYVSYNGYRSGCYTATSGVPQGSNLGPLLFIIYINDVLSMLPCESLAYADDLKIFVRIQTPEDSLMLQESLGILTRWCHSSGLRLNVDKCTVMSYGTMRTPNIHTYYIGDLPLSRSVIVRDLGVTFDCKLSFSEHIEAICGQALRSLGFVFRSAKLFAGADVLCVLYSAYVRSRLEYCSLVWYPYYVCHQLIVEKVQRRFLKFLSFRRAGVYPERGVDYTTLLAEHNFRSVQERRELRSCRFLGGLISGVIDCPDLLRRISFHVPRIAARTSDLFRVPNARTNISIRSPIGHMTRNGNRLFKDFV